MYMNKLMIGMLIVMATICQAAKKNTAPAERSVGETTAVFQASDILAAESLTGPNYWVNSRVTVEEYQYVFTVKSEFGEFTAKGLDMLDLRLRELRSIDAAKRLAKDQHFVEGLVKPLKNTVEGGKLILTQPLESLGRAPKGFGLMINQFFDASDRRAGTPVRRKLAVDIDCDPETNNPILKKLLDEMARKTGGGVVLTTAGMAFVPGLSLIPATAQIKDNIASNPPSVINKQINEELETAGVEKSIRSQFVKSRAFTTLERLKLMDQFRLLKGLPGRPALIEAAARATSEAEALGVIRQGKILVDIRELKPILRLEFVGLPLAVANDATHIFVSTYDYLTNTEELIEGVSAFRTSKPLVPAILVSSGNLSPAATQSVVSARILVIEKLKFNF